MFKAIGCLVVVLLALAGGWYLRGKIDGGRPSAEASVDVGTSLTPEGASRARSEIAGLARGRREYVAVQPGDFAAYVLASEVESLPPRANNVRANIEQGNLVLHAQVRPREMGDLGVLGPVAKLLRETEDVSVGGTLRVVRTGVAEFSVNQATLRTWDLPSVLIPRVVGLLGSAGRPEGTSPNAIPFKVPEHVADVRIAENRVLVYRRGR